MNFSKLLIIKSLNNQFFSQGKIIGVVKVEKNLNLISFIFDFYLSLPNDTYFFISDGNHYYPFLLNSNLKQSISLDDVLDVENFTFCLFQKGGDIFSIVYNGNCKIDAYRLKELIDENIEREQGQYVYDDEQIATVNYYHSNGLLNQNEDVDDNNSTQTEKEKTRDLLILNETIGYSNQNYYEKIKDKVNALISNNVKNDFLNAVYKGGVFVNVQYSKSNYYTFGVIYDDLFLKTAKYICYSVLGSFNKIPKGFENISKFIPLKNYLPYDDGYFIIFQDAITGKTLPQRL